MPKFNDTTIYGDLTVNGTIVNSDILTTIAATATTGAAGTSAAVTVNRDGNLATLSFTVPKGDKGDKGDTGAQGPKGDKGDNGSDGLTTKISLNGTTYTQSGGTITLPGLVRLDGNVGNEEDV